MEMINQNNIEVSRKSVGFIPYIIDVERNNDLRILLLFTKKGFWDFPKGGMIKDDNNDNIETAIRELKEEVGIGRNNIIKIFKNVHFSFSYHVHKKKKNVLLYLCKLNNNVVNQKASYDKKEIMFHEYVPLCEFMSRFTHKEDMEIAKDIYHYITINKQYLLTLSI